MTDTKTEKKKKKLEELDNLIHAILSDNKGKIKETICAFDEKNPQLVSLELIENDRVVLGIEYANNKPVKAYSADKIGKKHTIISLDNTEEEDYEIQQTITTKLQSFTNTRNVTKSQSTAKVVEEPQRKVRKTEVSKETADYIKTRGRTQV